ncbi:MAG: MlaD family protein [Flavobacteriaceae bacterium]
MKISREIKTTFLVSIGLAMFYFGFNFLKGKSIFNNQKEVYTLYEEVEGLELGAKVTINGLNIGKVSNIDLYPGTTKILVTMRLRPDMKFSPSSTAVLYEAGLIGGKAISISPDFASGAVIKSGDTLPAAVQPGLTQLINQQIAPLQQKITSTLTSVDSLFVGVRNVLDAQTQTNLKTSLEGLSRTIKNIDVLTNTMEKIVDANKNEIDTTLKNLAATTDNITTISDSLATLDVKAILSKYDAIAVKLDTILGAIEAGEGTAGKLINNTDVYDNLNATLAELEALLSDLKENPKRYVHFSLFGRKNKPYQPKSDKK